MNKNRLFSILRLGFAVLSLFVFALTFACSSGGTGSPPPPTGDYLKTPDAKKGNIVAYHPEWESIPTDAQLDRLTHIVLFSITPNNHRVPLPSGGWANNISGVVSRAHAKGVKVIIALGGWDRTGSFAESVKPANRQTFIKNIMVLVNQYNLDGVDIDWEYPNTSEEVTNFEGFMVDLKAALGNIRRLSFAIGAQYQPSKYTDATYNALDALHLMTYDGQGDGGRSHHADMAWSKSVVDTWVSSGKLTKEKIFYGVPFYGRPSSGWDVEDTYTKIISSNQATLSQTNIKTNHNVGSWTGTIYYDGVPQVKEKTKYAWDKDIGGIMIWETGQDVAATSQYSLLNAIYAETERLKGQ